MIDSLPYLVTLEHPHARRRVLQPYESQRRRVTLMRVEARSPHLAAKMAEATSPGTVATAVARPIAGHCVKCQRMLFAGEERKDRQDQLRCEDCCR